MRVLYKTLWICRMKYFLRVVGIIILISVGVIASEIIKAYTKSNVSTDAPLALKEKKIEQLDDLLRSVIKEQAKNLPMEVDGNTEVFQILYMSGQIHTSYRLLNIEKTNFQKEVFINQAYPFLKETTCLEPGTEIFRQRGEYSSHYKYYDRNNTYLATIVINEIDCNQP